MDYCKINGDSKHQKECINKKIIMATIIITLENASVYDVDALTIGMKHYIQEFAEHNDSKMKVSDISYY